MSGDGTSGFGSNLLERISANVWTFWFSPEIFSGAKYIGIDRQIRVALLVLKSPLLLGPSHRAQVLHASPLSIVRANKKARLVRQVQHLENRAVLGPNNKVRGVFELRDGRIPRKLSRRKPRSRCSKSKDAIRRTLRIEQQWIGFVASTENHDGALELSEWKR